MEKLVTVATYNFPAEADVQRLLLEQEGIQTFLADGNLVGMDWLYSNAVGGVKIQVAASDADRAMTILAKHCAAKTADELSGEDVTFACQECGKSVTFPGQRRGHVETCPHCSEYVDVPEINEDSIRAEGDAADAQTTARFMETEQPTSLDSSSRTNSQLWIEVFAVLCLTYIPYLFGALTAMNGDHSTSYSLTNGMLYRIVGAFRVSMPLLVILALAKDRWSLFGIVRQNGSSMFLPAVPSGCARSSHTIPSCLCCRRGCWKGRHLRTPDIKQSRRE